MLMYIGVPKEIKNNEFRVAITPAAVREFASRGHRVLIQSGAGLGCAITDEDFKQKGAVIVKDAGDIYAESDMILKVKEPLVQEFDFLRENQILFTFLHLAVEPELTNFLIKKHVIAIAYETIQLKDKSLPLLAPMSEIAGRMAPQIGAHLLEKMNGGRGVLLGGVAGVEKAKVLILGGGIVGRNAAKIALGLGASVMIMDSNVDCLRYLEDILHGKVETVASNYSNIERHVKQADLIIGAVLVPGAKAPYLITEDMVKQMKEGSVIVDISIDQGGCVETSEETTHSEPTFIKHGVIHYCVQNIPGAVPHTSTFALTNVTIPYALNIADMGIVEAVKNIPELAKGINVIEGKVTYEPVANALNISYFPLSSIIPQEYF
jgi:alanine dehydrogenase